MLTSRLQLKFTFKLHVLGLDSIVKKEIIPIIKRVICVLHCFFNCCAKVDIFFSKQNSWVFFFLALKIFTNSEQKRNNIE